MSSPSDLSVPYQRYPTSHNRKTANLPCTKHPKPQYISITIPRRTPVSAKSASVMSRGGSQMRSKAWDGCVLHAPLSKRFRCLANMRAGSLILRGWLAISTTARASNRHIAGHSSAMHAFCTYITCTCTRRVGVCAFPCMTQSRVNSFGLPQPMGINCRVP